MTDNNRYKSHDVPTLYGLEPNLVIGDFPGVADASFSKALAGFTHSKHLNVNKVKIQFLDV